MEAPEVTGVVSHPLRRTAIAVAIALGVAVLVAWAAGFDAVHAALRGVRPGWLAVVVGGQVLSFAGYVLAYRQTVRAAGGPRLRTGAAARLVAVGFGAFSIGGGFAVDRRALLGLGAPRGGAEARVLGLGALEYAVLAPVAWVCAIVLILTRDRHPGMTWPWAIGVPLGGAIALSLLRRREAFAQSGGTVRGALARGLDGLAHLLRLARHPVRHWAAWAGLAAYWAGEVVALWAALRAFGAAPGTGVLVVGFATGYAATRRTLPLAGAGATEALMPYALHWLGLALAPALLGVVAYRAADLLLTLPPALALRRSVAPLVRRGYRLQPD